MRTPERVFSMVPALLILASAASLQAGGIPIQPYAEVTVATPGPLSLFCTPAGGGQPLTEAFGPAGQIADGTISMILYEDIPPFGSPVPFYPREDMWLFDTGGGLAFCPGGTIPDADTDADGWTSWTRPLRAGGQVDTAAGSELAVMVNGWILGEGMLADYRTNSSDFNGDGAVNLTDVAIFSTAYFGPYSYDYDLRRDGVVNLSDLALLAATYGDQCP